MPWTDWKFPTSSSTPGAGLSNVVAVDNIEADDGNMAETDIKTGPSEYMLGVSYGLTASDVPASANIIAVQVETESKGWPSNGAGVVYTFYVGLFYGISGAPSVEEIAGAQTGTYTANSSVKATATFQVDTFTGLFGKSLTQAIVTNADFGAWLQADSSTATGGDEEFGVDYIKLRVLWEYPGSGLIGDI